MPVKWWATLGSFYQNYTWKRYLKKLRMERSEYIQRETKKATCIFISKQNQEQNPIYVKHLEMIITQAKKR